MIHRLAALLPLLAVLILASPAEGRVIGWEGYQRWTDAALVPGSPVDVTVSNDPCPLAAPDPRAVVTACYDPSRTKMYLHGPKATDRVTYFHEYGHHFDTTVLTDAYRDGFRRIACNLGGPWFGAQPGDESCGERFASAYSLCARRARVSADYHSVGPGAGYGYAPTPRQHRRVCALIRRAAA